MQTMSGAKKILLVSGDARQIPFLSGTLRNRVVLDCAGSISEMLDLLAHDNYDLVLSDWHFGLESWRDALDAVSQCDPELPVAVLCPKDAEEDWLETLKE